MVVLLVLGMLILLVIFTTVLNDASLALQIVEKRVRLKEQNYLVARSAVELAMDLLRVDKPDVDSGRDVWNLGAQRLTWEGRELFLEIRDEESRFPLNMLPLDPRLPNQDLMLYEQALERLVTRAGLGGPQAVPVLMDWMDPDENERSNGGEQGTYPQLLVKNGPLDDIDELERLRNWGPPNLPAPIPLDASTGRLEEYAPSLLKNQAATGTSLWSDWLSAYAQGKINVNTAPAEVLRCLDQAMSDAVVSEIVARRSTKVLKSEQDLKEIPGIDADLAFRLGKLVGFKSSTFRVRVVVTSQETPLDLEVMLERQSQREINVRYWRAR
jgi:general secretion pathway protein K